MAVMSPVYNKVVYCDQNVGEQDDIHQASQLNISKKVGSINEMANSLHHSNREEHKNYNFVVICGHALPGLQGLGSEQIEQYIRGKDFSYKNLQDIDSEITLISNALNTNCNIMPILFLAGCEAGSGRQGSQLLKNLSYKLRNVLVVASEDPLTYKISSIGNRITSMTIQKLVKKRPSPIPPEFKFAINGTLIGDDHVFVLAGVKADTIRSELTVIDNTL